MSSLTAAGSTLWIKEVCDCQDAHLEALIADFWSFADDLDQCRPSTHASFASLDDNDNDDKDEAINIVLSIDDADVEFEDIAVVLPPLRQFPMRVRLCPSWGGNVHC